MFETTVSACISHSQSCGCMCFHGLHETAPSQHYCWLHIVHFLIPRNNLSHFRHGLCFRGPAIPTPLISQLPFDSKHWPCNAIIYVLGNPLHIKDGKLQKLQRLACYAAVDCPRGHLDSSHCHPMLTLNFNRAPSSVLTTTS